MTQTTMNAAALEYAIEILQEKLTELRGEPSTRRLNAQSSPSPAPKPRGRQPGRKLSAAARKAIGDAQRRRWAARLQPAQAETPAEETTTEAEGGTKSKKGRKAKGAGD